MIKILFLQKFEAFYGFTYLFAIYKRQSVKDKDVWMKYLALSALAGSY